MSDREDLRYLNDQDLAAFIEQNRGGMKCATCCFWEHHEEPVYRENVAALESFAVDDTALLVHYCGDCHRYPPVVDHPEAEDGEMWFTATKWREWCGEYKPASSEFPCETVFLEQEGNES
jgi:hypothetical protein